jgi:hypothetical protein
MHRDRQTLYYRQTDVVRYWAFLVEEIISKQLYNNNNIFIKLKTFQIVVKYKDEHRSTAVC